MFAYVCFFRVLSLGTHGRKEAWESPISPSLRIFRLRSSHGLGCLVKHNSNEKKVLTSIIFNHFNVSLGSCKHISEPSVPSLLSYFLGCDESRRRHVSEIFELCCSKIWFTMLYPCLSFFWCVQMESVWRRAQYIIWNAWFLQSYRWAPGMMLQIFSAWQLKKQSVSLVDCQDSCMEQQKDKDWVTAWEYIWASLWPHLVENPNLQWHSELEGLDGFISGDHQFWRISSWSFLWSQHQRTVIIIAMHQRFKKAPYPLTGITMHHHPSICSTLEFVCR